MRFVVIVSIQSDSSGSVDVCFVRVVSIFGFGREEEAGKGDFSFPVSLGNYGPILWYPKPRECQGLTGTVETRNVYFWDLLKSVLSNVGIMGHGTR